MRQKVFAALIFVTMSLLLVFGVQNIMAQDTGGTGFRLSPAKYELDIDPGESVVRTIEVTNLTNGAQKAIPVVNDFTASDLEDGSPRLLTDSQDESNPRSIRPFVLPLNEFSLEPGESENVDVVFSIPEDASPGAYYGTVRFVAESAIQGEEGNISLNASVGTVFLINVTGDTVSLLTVEEIGPISEAGGDIGRLFSSAPNRLAVRISNQGNTFEAPFGKVAVKDWRGNVVDEYELNSKDPRGNVLPDSIRKFEQEIEGVGSFGRYTVEAFISYGEGGNVIEASSTFWVVPWLQLFIGALAIAGLAFLGTRGIKAYNAKVISKSKGKY